MPSRSRTLILIALALLLGGLGYRILLGEPGHDGGREPTEAPASAAPEPGDPPAAVPTVDDLRITIRTVDRGRILAQTSEAEVPCRLSIGRHELPARARLIAGPGAVDVAAARGRHVVRFELAGGEAFCRVLDLDGGPIELRLRERTLVEGRIVDAEGAGIAGVEVWVGTLRAGQLERVVSAEDGSFAIEARYGCAGLPVVFTDPHHAWHFRIVDAFATANLRVDPVLEPATVVEVQLAAALERAELGVVDVVPAGDDTALRHYPFFLATLEARPSLDRAGRCEFPGLPSAGSVRISVRHPDTLATRPARIDLARPERAIVAADAAPRMASARVTDLQGVPIAGARVVLRPSRGAEPRLLASGWALPPSAHLADVPFAHTDAEGRFRIGCERRDQIVSVSAPGWLGIERDYPERADRAEDVALPRPLGDTAGDPVLRVRIAAPSGREFRLRKSGGTWQRWIDTEPIEIAFETPRLVDVEVTIQPTADAAVVERTFVSQPIVGLVEIEIDA